MKRLYLGKNEIVFAIFGGWRAYGAKRFGQTVNWKDAFGRLLKTSLLNHNHCSVSRTFDLKTPSVLTTV
jgi:hypothetical protein